MSTYNNLSGVNREVIIVFQAISIIATTCCASEEKIIDLLSGYIFTKEEAEQLKNLMRFSPNEVFRILLENSIKNFTKKFGDDHV